MDTFEHHNVVTGNRFNTGSSNYATATCFVLNTQQDDNMMVNNIGCNPIGKITNPFWTTTNTIIMNSGNSATPNNSTDTTNANVNLFMTISGGSTVSITLKDNNGNVIQSGLTTITQQYIPFGYKINVSWHTIPTFTVYAQ